MLMEKMTPASLDTAPVWALRVDTRGMMPQTNLGHADPDVDATLGRRRFPVEKALRERGFRPYIPTESWSRRMNRFTRQRVTTTRALIPGLILCPIEHDADWPRLFSTPYVLGFFGILRGIRSVDVAAIMAMERHAVERPADSYLLVPGSLAEITHGPFKGFTAEMTKLRHDLPTPMAEALVNLLGRRTAVNVPIADLKGATA